MFLEVILKDGSLFNEITQEQVLSIFYNLPEIIEFENDLLKSLTKLGAVAAFLQNMVFHFSVECLLF